MEKCNNQEIELVFENCDGFKIKVKSFRADKSFEKGYHDQVIESSDITIIIPKEENVRYTNAYTSEEGELKFNRIMACPNHITQILIGDFTFFPEWEDANIYGTLNKYQTTYYNEDGDLVISICK